MGHLLAIDVGNTNTVLGVFQGEDLRASYRMRTVEERTADEMAITVNAFLAMDGMVQGQIEACIISTVVPPVLDGLMRYCKSSLSLTPWVVGVGMESGMPILCDAPKEVGADRIVNAVAAYALTKDGTLVIDFGTATTWDLISSKGEYLGGVIAPGIGISAEALYKSASKLPRVDLVRPTCVVGTDTVTSMQSGLVFGYAGMVDAIVGRIRDEIDFEVACLATGGLAPLFAEECQSIQSVEEDLTLRGLQIIYARNALPS